MPVVLPIRQAVFPVNCMRRRAARSKACSNRMLKTPVGLLFSQLNVRRRIAAVLNLRSEHPANTYR
jgi:hypothetical protein